MKDNRKVSCGLLVAGPGIFMLWLSILIAACPPSNGSAVDAGVAEAFMLIAESAASGATISPSRIADFLNGRRPKIMPVISGAHSSTPDPRVTECVDRAVDESTLMNCLKNVPVSTGLDAGRRLGAGGASPTNPCSALAVPDWHFSPTGNDQNTCTDAAHPCANPARVQSRWGCGAGPVTNPTLLGNVIFHFHGDMPRSSSFHIDPFMANGGGGFSIVCDTTQISSGSLSGVVSKNRGASQALDANLGASLSSFVGSQLINTTRGSALGWVDSIVLAVDGGPTGVGLLTQPLTQALPINNWAEVDTYANGDNFTIQRPGQIFMSEMTGTCEAWECYQGFPLFGNQPLIDNCWVQPLPGLTEMLTLNAVTVIRSRIDGSLKANDLHLHNSIVTHCPIELDNTTIAAGAITSAGDLNGGNVGVLLAGASNQFGGWWAQDVIVHGTVSLTTAAILTVNQAYFDFPPGIGGLQSGLEVNGYVFPNGLNTPIIYGAARIHVWQNGYYSFESVDASVFGPGVTLAIQGPHGLSTAIAMDYAHTPSLPYIRNLTPALLLATVESGGFGGIALPDNLLGGFFNWAGEDFPTQIPFVWGGGNGGTNLDAGCPDGAPLVGLSPTSFVCGPTPTAGATLLCNTTASGLRWVAPGSCN